MRTLTAVMTFAAVLSCHHIATAAEQGFNERGPGTATTFSTAPRPPVRFNTNVYNANFGTTKSRHMLALYPPPMPIPDSYTQRGESLTETVPPASIRPHHLYTLFPCPVIEPPGYKERESTPLDC